MTNEPQHGLGRIGVPDARDGQHPMRAFLGPVEARSGVRVWECPTAPLDQLQESTCVGHAWKHWELTEPVIRSTPTGDPTAGFLYDWACDIDEFPANDNHDRHYGTSVRAGAEVMRALGLMTEYVHAQSMDDVIAWLLDRGPIVVGTNWLADMFGPFNGTKIRVSGDIVGGHAFLLQGIDTPQNVVLMRNSWGSSWGPWANGLAHIGLADLATLLFAQGGDAIAGVELDVVTPPPPPTTLLTFADAEAAGLAAQAALPRPTSKYTSAAYRLQGAEAVTKAIALRRAQGGA